MQPHTDTYHETSVARFALGQTVITPGAEEALELAGQTATEFLRRHMSGDWGDLSDDDVKGNELSLEKGLRLSSRYETAKGERLWIITEADRSATIVFVPLEY